LTDGLERVFWLGGMSGVGKTTAARALARRHDLRLYSFDAYQFEHAHRLPPETRTLDEIWVEMTPEQLADWFEQQSRRRFELVLADLLALRDDAPVLVDGPQALPELVAPLVPGPEHALYVVASREMQEPLVRARGSGIASKVSDPERAAANRLGRDEELVRRLRAGTAKHGLPLVEVQDVTETLPAIERHFEPLLRSWIGRPHGDVGARRRDENDARLRQWRFFTDSLGTEPAGELDLACECDTPGCSSPVTIGLLDAEAARERGASLLAH
jgi:ATPase family protein associated with various cellular activities (AAA)